jgi:Protein of unknown function (DUF2934)
VMTRKSGAANFRVTSIPANLSHKVDDSMLPEHAEKIIRRRAYELYEERGRQDGHAEEDWLRAEAEILGTLLRRGGTE